MSDATEPFHEVVTLAVAAFVGCDDDDAVRRCLARAGVSTELIDELVAFVPMAFGRKLLDAMGVSTWPTFDVMNQEGRPSRERRFDESGVYLAARDAAHRASRDVFQRIATWSAEVGAVNKLAGSGSPSSVRLTKALVWTPHLLTGAPARPPPRLADVHGAHDDLARALAAHGVSARRTTGGIELDSGASWEAKVWANRCSSDQTVLQVDFVFRSPLLGDRTLVESFGGYGATVPEAIRNAFEKFLLGTFHVIASAFLEVTSEQVEWERWSGSHGTFRVALGSLLRNGEAPSSDAFPRLLDHVQKRLTARDLTHEAHCLRLYHARSMEPFGFEALLDGEAWPELQADLEAWPFPPSTSWYSERLFIILLPTESIALV